MSRVATPYLKYKPKELKDLTWRIIVEGWENGMSNPEIALRLSKDSSADQMTASDINKMLTAHPELKEMKALLNIALLSAARQTVAEAVKDGDVKTAKWFLERKAADEFSTKQAVAFEGAVIELSIEDKEKALKEMVEKYEESK